MADVPKSTPGQEYSDDLSSISEPNAAEIKRLKQELEIVKNANPFRTAEIAIELQIERLRVVEISRARDAALQQLSECCIVIRQKNELIARLQDDDSLRNVAIDVSSQTDILGGDIEDVKRVKAHIYPLDLETLPTGAQNSKPLDLPPCYEVDKPKVNSIEAAVQTDNQTLALNSNEMLYTPPQTDMPQESLEARNAFLASIPLPENLPDATLTGFKIPQPFTIQDFLDSAPTPLRTVIGNNKILQNGITYWCPEREEHGFMYSPAFKCCTNPRIATAHRWTAVDVIGCMANPTECFYNKDSAWYYAGTYRALHMDELSVKEWAELPAETVSAIVKETLSDRKHICPQNNYETTQLYAAGALKVACVALLCVGFNQDVYRSVLEYSVKFRETKWKVLANASVKILSGAIQSNPNTPANESGNTLPPAGLSPIVPKHFPRTRVLSTTNLTNCSPPLRGGQYEIPNYCSSPPMGLGFGSSTWCMVSNSKVDSIISLDTSELEPTEDLECSKGNA